MRSCFFLCVFVRLGCLSVGDLDFLSGSKKQVDIPFYNLYIKEIESVLRVFPRSTQSYDSLVNRLKKYCSFLGINDLRSTQSLEVLKSIFNWSDATLSFFTKESDLEVLKQACFVVNMCAKRSRPPRGSFVRNGDPTVLRQKKTYWDICCLSRLAQYSDKIKGDVSNQFKNFLKTIYGGKIKGDLSDSDLNQWVWVLLNGFDNSVFFKRVGDAGVFDGFRFFGIWSNESSYTCENDVWKRVLNLLSFLSFDRFEDSFLKEEWCDGDEFCKFLFRKSWDDKCGEYVVRGLVDGRSAILDINLGDVYNLGHPKTELRKMLLKFQLLIRSLISISEQIVKNYWEMYEAKNDFRESVDGFVKDNLNELFSTYRACLSLIEYYFQVNKTSTCCLGYSPTDLEDKAFLVCDNIDSKNIMLLFYELGGSVDGANWDYLEDLTEKFIDFDESHNLNIGLRDLFDLLRRCLWEQSANELGLGVDEGGQTADISAAEKQSQQKNEGIKNSENKKIPDCISGSAIVFGTFIEASADYKFFVAGEVCFLLGKLEFGPKIVFLYKNRLFLDWMTTYNKNCLFSVTGLIVSSVGFQVRYWLNEKKATISFSYRVESQSFFVNCVAGIMV